MVSVLDCQAKGSGFKPAMAAIWFEISAPPALPSQICYDEYIDRTLSVEDETVRERTGHPPSYAEAKKMKLLTLHTHGCPMAI